ncbi:MAG: Stage sporulation protein [Patescibacteria group bacterium]|nr:Stage sporulation protein [Patescibacteria group bacterium]
MLKKVDKPLLITIAVLLFFGLLAFSSAALGVLASNEVKFYSIIKNQLIFALLGGVIAISLGIIIPYRLYERFGYHLFFLALLATTLVFVPGLSIYHGGAHRWIDLGPVSFQPSELLKMGFVIAVALWCSKNRHLFRSWKYGLLPFAVGSGLVASIMLAQPDFGTFLIIMTAGTSVFFVGGARLRHLGIIAFIAIIGFATLVSFRPYMMERIKTFFNDTHDPRGASWQVNQSLVAIGSGGLFGRGLGQSVQKFNFLPEPIGDSIFAVTAEELGMLGVLFLLSLYAIVGIRGYMISLNAESQFARLLGIGIVTIVLTQTTINIMSMLGLFPLTGVPLPLISHGGTALMVTLFELGVLLQISKTSNL